MHGRRHTRAIPLGYPRQSFSVHPPALCGCVRFKRVEDLCWLKTNKGRQDQGCATPAISAILTRTKEHCLVAMKGEATSEVHPLV